MLHAFDKATGGLTLNPALGVTLAYKSAMAIFAGTDMTRIDFPVESRAGY
jgi:hypothetical protein